MRARCCADRTAAAQAWRAPRTSSSRSRWMARCAAALRAPFAWLGSPNRAPFPSAGLEWPSCVLERDLEPQLAARPPPLAACSQRHGGSLLDPRVLGPRAPTLLALRLCGETGTLARAPLDSRVLSSLGDPAISCALYRVAWSDASPAADMAAEGAERCVVLVVCVGSTRACVPDPFCSSGCTERDRYTLTQSARCTAILFARAHLRVGGSPEERDTWTERD